MSEVKAGLGIDVLTAARRRIALVFDEFERICISYSGGKDSTVMLHLVMEEARRRDRRIGLLFVDLEAQYAMTVAHIDEMLALYRDHLDVHWVALPIALRNAVSQFEPKWMCWAPARRDDWVRTPPQSAITHPEHYPFFRVGMEFEEFVAEFGRWYATGDDGRDVLTAFFVGIRADESLNRFRTVMRDISRYNGHKWTVWKGGGAFNAYPIYDWRTADIWTYLGRTGLPYNRLYDRMHQAGLSIHQMRICQPYGDDQRKGLWLFHLIEPHTWPKIIARVNGANSGSLYARESGNVLGNIRISRPPGHSWESFSKLLLASMPGPTREHYENKIAVFLHWWGDRGYQHGIPDEDDPKREAAKEVPTWRRIAKALLKNDYWCKTLSFGQHKAESYERYRKVMTKRRATWGY